MTSCADLTAETGELEAHTMDSARVSSAGEAKHHFKSSWPEDDRPKEAHIIETAEERVRLYLPGQFQPFVLDHLPKVSETSVVFGTCTAIVRALLDLSTEGSRTQYLMISKKLTSLRTIAHDYESFRPVFIDIIRGTFYLSSCLR